MLGRRTPQCAVCPMPGGALKPSVDGVRWVHILCTLWISEMSFVDPNAMEPIDGIDKALAARKHFTCELCKRKGGACIQCHQKGWCVHTTQRCATHRPFCMSLFVLCCVVLCDVCVV